MWYCVGVVYINFKRRQGRKAAIHTEECRNAQVWAFSDLRAPERGYWLRARDEKTAVVVAQDLQAIPSPAGCCHRPGQA